MSREAMKLALEALETVAADVKTTPTAYEAQRQAITALREALAEQPAQRKPLTLEEIDLLINGRGEPDDDDYVEPTGDGFGLTDADLVRLVRRTEAAHNIKENT